MSDSLRPRELQHARLPYPSLSPGICSNSVSIESVMPSNHLILCHPLLLYDFILPQLPPKGLLLNMVSVSTYKFCCCSVTKSCLTLWPHGLPHTRLPCSSSLSPGGCSNSCPLSLWWILSNHLILCHPLLLLPSIFPNNRIISNESALHIRWPKQWRLRFNISPSNEYPRLISFRIDCFDLLAIKGISRVLSSTTVWKHQFFRAQSSLWTKPHIYTWQLEKP